MSKCLTGGPDQSQKLLESLRNELNERFQDIEGNQLPSEASFLDPRFKKHAFSNRDKYEKCLKTIKIKLRSLDYPRRTGTDASPQQEAFSMWAEFEREFEKEVIKEV